MRSLLVFPAVPGSRCSMLTIEAIDSIEVKSIHQPAEGDNARILTTITFDTGRTVMYYVQRKVLMAYAEQEGIDVPDLKRALYDGTESDIPPVPLKCQVVGGTPLHAEILPSRPAESDDTHHSPGNWARQQGRVKRR